MLPWCWICSICQHHAKTKESDWCVPRNLCSVASLNTPYSLKSSHQWACAEHRLGNQTPHGYTAKKGLGLSAMAWPFSSFQCYGRPWKDNGLPGSLRNVPCDERTIPRLPVRSSLNWNASEAWVDTVWCTQKTLPSFVIPVLFKWLTIMLALVLVVLFLSRNIEGIL